jgi:hypothetical protein
VVSVSGIGGGVSRHLLDNGGMIVEECGMRDIIDETSQLARDRIAGK